MHRAGGVSRSLASMAATHGAVLAPGPALTAEELAAAKAFGMTPEEYAANKTGAGRATS